MSSPAALTLRCVFVAAALELLLPRTSRADDSLSYKFQSWREEGDRIHVESHYALAEQNFPAETKLKLQGVIDTIAGATPTGQLPATPGGEVPLSEIYDRRKAWQAEISKQVWRSNLAMGYANSRESDYVSNGWSLNTQTDFNQKNTTLLVGVGGAQDKVRVFFQPRWERKRSLQGMVGLTQLLNPETSVSVNLTYARDSGYLSDPYRLIEKHVEVGEGLTLLRTFGENRPDEREKWIGLVSLNRAVPALRGAAEATCRLYHDEFGITAQTVSLEWFQRLWTDRLILRPGIRWYQQSAADFYRTTLDGSPIVPGERPNAAGPFYSADYRLSRMRTLTLGIKAVFTVVPDRFAVDLSVERYLMSGRDQLTPRSAYADATIVTAGAAFSW